MTNNEYILINVAGAIITDEIGRVLLVKRSNEVKHEKGKWSLPGGKTEAGENFEDALGREVKEELSCDINCVRFFKSYYTVINDTHARMAYFSAKLVGQIKLQTLELIDYAWIELSDLEKQELAFNHKSILRNYAEYINSIRSGVEGHIGEKGCIK